MKQGLSTMTQSSEKPLIESQHGILWRQIARFHVVHLHNSEFHVRFVPQAGRFFIIIYPAPE